MTEPDDSPDREIIRPSTVFNPEHKTIEEGDSSDSLSVEDFSKIVGSALMKKAGIKSGSFVRKEPS